MKNKALLESAAKILFSQVPFANQLLTEAFFDYRSRIKQDRLNTFIENLIHYLNPQSLETITEDLISSEDFGDLFESVIRRVVQTNSHERLVIFKNVLVGYIAEPVKNDYQDTFLDIIDRVNTSQVKILEAHGLLKEDIRKLLKQREYYTSEMTRLNNELKAEQRLFEHRESNNYYDTTKDILSLNNKLKIINEAIELDGKVRNAQYYGIEEGEYLFLVQDLYAKGLLMDQGIGAIDTRPFEKMSITHFGKAFLDFIRNDK